MKSLVIAGRRLPVDPLLETLGLLLADDYFGVGIMVQAQDEFAAEIVAQIADALHADDVLAVGAEEAGRISCRSSSSMLTETDSEVPSSRCRRTILFSVNMWFISLTETVL